MWPASASCLSPGTGGSTGTCTRTTWTAAEAVDLGSADVKLLDLSSELVVLDWVYDPTLEHVGRLVSDSALGIAGQRDELARFSFRLALRLLERVGFGPLTRPTLLRIGFRDICRR